LRGVSTALPGTSFVQLASRGSISIHDTRSTAFFEEEEEEEEEEERPS
tara:strand:- start:1400 stop:1543 length:144 start_codon:yes stop_codon:yes gene_type:complete